MKQFKKIQRRLGRSSFSQDIVLTAMGQFIVLAIALAINKLLSIFLGPEQFAIFTIANKSAGVIAFLMLMGIGIALPRYLARVRVKGKKSDEASVYYASLIIFAISTSIVFLICTVFGDTIGNFIFNGQSHNDLIFPMLIFAVSTATSAYLYSFLRGIDKFRLFNVIQVIVGLIGLGAVLFYGNKINEQLLARGFLISIATLIILATLTYSAYRVVKLERKQLKTDIKKVFLYSVLRVPGEIFLFSFSVVPLILINTRFGLQTAAAFATAVTINLLVVPIFQFVGMVLLPYVSKQLARGEGREITRKINTLRAAYLLIAVTSLIGVYFLTDLIIQLLFTSEYVQFAAIVRILYVSVVPYSLYLLLRNPIDAISAIPFNTINLGISFGVLIAGIMVAPNAIVCAILFPVSYLILGLLSEFVWRWRFRLTNLKNNTDVNKLEVF